MQPTEVDFGRLSVGAAAHTALQFMEEELHQLQYDIDRAMYAKIEQGTLTPEDAMMAFGRKHTAWKILLRASQKINTGQSAARRLAEQGV
jgi:hypothetical protein